MSRHPVLMGNSRLERNPARTLTGPRRTATARCAAALVVCLVVAAARGQVAGSAGSATQPDLDPHKAHVPLAEIQGATIPSSQAAQHREDEPEIWARYQKAQVLVESGQYAQAVVELDAALRQATLPEPDMLYLLAQAKRGLGRLGEARLAAQLAAAVRPGAPEIHLLLGRLDRAQGRLDSASAHFRSATLASGKQPDDPRITVAWYELGDCLTQAGYLAAASEALEHFDRTLWEEHPEQRRDDEIAAILKSYPYGAIERRLELARRLDRPAELTRAAEWAFKTRPNEPYLERLYLRTLLDAGQAATAFEFCKERLTQSFASAAPPAGASAPGSVAAEPRAALLLTLAIESGQASNQLPAWVAQLAEDVAQGQHADLAHRLAVRLDGLHADGLSIPLWQALATAQPEDPGPAWALASAFKESGDLAAALRPLIAFVRRNADQAEIEPDRLAAWMRSFQATDEFLRLVSDWTARDDCDFAAHTVLGTTAAAAGQTELAEQLFRSALEDRPDFALAHVAWGRMLLDAERWDDALTQAEQALTRTPKLPAAQFLLGAAYTGLDRTAEAEQAYKVAADARPREVTYVLALARHYRRAGNLLAAQRYFQHAWSLDHTLGEAIEELIDCYLEGGKAEIARATLQEAEASDLPDDVLRRIRTVMRFAAEPMQAEHLAELARQFAQHPDDVTTGLRLAAGLYLNQRADEALPILQQVQARAPREERGAYLLARVYLRRLENDRAITLLEELVRRYPRRPAALRLLAESYLADFRVTETRATLERLLALDPSDEQRDQLRNRLLGICLEFADFAAALDMVEDWSAAEPANDAWTQARLRVLLAADRNQEAADLAAERLAATTRHFDGLRDQFNADTERLRKDPNDADLQAQLEHQERELKTAAADVYARRAEFVQVGLDTKRYEPTEAQVRAWLVDQPGEPQLQDWLVEILLAGKQADRALDAIRELTPKNPGEVLKAFIWRAHAFAMSGKLDSAVNDLTALLEEGFVQSDPAGRVQVRQELLTLLVDARQFDRAVALCDRWATEVPAGDRASQLGVLLLKRSVLAAADRLEEQSVVTEELLAAQPYDPGLNNDLAYTWADAGQHLDRALPMLKLAVAAEPLNPAFLDSLGWAYYKSGDFGTARVYLTRSVRLHSGQDSVVYDHAGDAEYRLGNRAAAEAHWRKALQLLMDRATENAAARDAQLIATLRAKLDAIEQSRPPAVAPLASTQDTEEPK